jgi:HAD superfamily hydrolase (TIGR01490 family)
METIAFFDLDYTLLGTSSGLLYVQEIIRQRRAPLWFVGAVGLRYQLWRDFGRAHTALITQVGRQGPAEAAQFFADWIPRRLLPRLTSGGRAKIEWHRHQGHRVVLISASIEEIVRPVAEHLDVAHVATRLAVRDGQYTGELAGPLCYGLGKVYGAKQWAAQKNLDFSQAAGYFYTDSSSDLPLLELVAHPVAVNPSRKLARIAAARGWPIEKFY